MVYNIVGVSEIGSYTLFRNYLFIYYYTFVLKAQLLVTKNCPYTGKHYIEYTLKKKVKYEKSQVKNI